MTRARPTHRRCASAARGFTLVEMLVVMTMIALLLTLVVPSYFSAIDNGKLNVQRQNLSTMRDAIDKFFGDQGRYPDSLDELVSKRYLRSIPIDPVSDASDWIVVAPPDANTGAVFDVQAPPTTAAPTNGSPALAGVESD